MKTVILAGGMGSRLSEETVIRPKPMVEIGGHPILWHIMKTYDAFGYSEFIICCGYKGDVIKKYFLNYYIHQTDAEFFLGTNSVRCISPIMESWKVTLANTGLRTMTAGRVRKIRDYVQDETFFLTYGDGVADVNIEELLRFHREHGRIMTITVTKPAGRFGVLTIDEQSGLVKCFQEKSRKDQGYINMGFIVCEPEIFEYLGDDSEMLEEGPFRRLLEKGQIAAYCHRGFWSPMDNIKDREYLETLWETREAPWKI